MANKSNPIEYTVVLKQASIVFNGFNFAICEMEPDAGPVYSSLPIEYLYEQINTKFQRGDDCEHFLICVPITFILATFFKKKNMMNSPINGMDGIDCNCTELIMKYEMALTW